MSAQFTQVFAKVPLYGKYTNEDKPHLQKLIFKAVGDAEEQFKQSQSKSSDRMRLVYVTQPKGATFATANKIKCIAYSYTPSGEVRYGACIWTRDGSKFDTDSTSVRSGHTGGHMSTSTTKSVFGESVFTKENKKNTRETATARYNKCPRTFKMEFVEQLNRVTNVKNFKGQPVDVKNHNYVTREEQVVSKIEKLMLDKVNGGVRGDRLKESEGKKSANYETILEFASEENELSEELVEQIEEFFSNEEIENDENKTTSNKVTRVKMVQT